MKLYYVILLCSLLVKCQSNTSPPPEEMQTLVVSEIEDFWGHFRSNDMRWVNYYQEEFILVFPNGSIESHTPENLKMEFERLYREYQVLVAEMDQLKVIASKDQVVSIFPYEQIFIHKENQDTIINRGTLTYAWKKQQDNRWKISFETYHLKN